MQYCNSCGAENPSDATSCFACQHSLPELDMASASAKHISSPLVLIDVTSLLHNRYRKLEQVGTGGFGAVYKAEDTQDNNRVVALKEINIGGLQPRQVIDATNTFNREVELLSMLSHPNLPNIYEHFTDSEHWYVIMDFIEGQTLEAYLLLHGGKLPVSDVLSIGIQLCDVLDYLHTRQPPIIFRDLKPANIMLTQHKQVYLIDFGTARFFKPGKPKDTIAFGSPGYAAPEQYGKAQTTPRSDLYSLGATLHQLLTGHDPSDMPFQFPPVQVPGEILPPKLEPLIMSMVSLDAGKRPESAQEVKQELQQLSLQHSRRLYPNSLYTMGTKAQFQSFTPPPSLPLPPSPPSEWTTSAPSVQQAQQMLGIPVTSNPDAKKNSISRRVVVTGLITTVITASFFGASSLFSERRYRRSHRGFSDIQQRPDPHFNPQLLYTYKGHHDSITAVGWNRTNTRVASSSEDGTVQIWDYNTGKHTLTYKGHQGPVTAFSWSPDGMQIASIGSDGSLQVWDANQGIPTATHWITSDLGAFTSVAWSPNGKSIAVASQQVQIVDVRTATTARLNNIQNNLIYGLSWSTDGQHLAIGDSSGNVSIYTPANNTLSPLSMESESLPSAVSALTWIGFSNTRLAIAVNSKESQNYRVELWDTPDDSHYISSLHNSEWIFSVASTPDGRYLASGGNYKQVTVWNLNDNTFGVYSNHTDTVRTVAWSYDGSMIASGGDDDTVQVWKP